MGRVKRTIYRTYLSAWGPFFLVPISMFSIALVERALQVRIVWTDCVQLNKGRHVGSWVMQGHELLGPE